MPTVPPERPGCPKAPGGRRPLPDPAAIQLFLVPESAPPYDEDIPAGETGGRLPSGPPRGQEPGGQGDARRSDHPPHVTEPWDRGDARRAGHPPHGTEPWDRGDAWRAGHPPHG